MYDLKNEKEMKEMKEEMGKIKEILKTYKIDFSVLFDESNYNYKRRYEMAKKLLKVKKLSEKNIHHKMEIKYFEDFGKHAKMYAPKLYGDAMKINISTKLTKNLYLYVDEILKEYEAAYPKMEKLMNNIYNLDFKHRKRLENQIKRDENVKVIKIKFVRYGYGTYSSVVYSNGYTEPYAYNCNIERQHDISAMPKDYAETCIGMNKKEFKNKIKYFKVIHDGGIDSYIDYWISVLYYGEKEIEQIIS